MQLNPNAFGGIRQKDIVSIREKVLPKFLEVSKVVEEGNEFCKKTRMVPMSLTIYAVAGGGLGMR